MLSELLQDRAALYVSGAMLAPERESFELVLEFHKELRAHVAGLQEAMTTVARAQVKPIAPPAGLKERLLRSAVAQPLPAEREEAEGLVVTGADGRIEWVNAAFTAMCGFALDELRGRKPGQLLQGAATDLAPVDRIRASVRERQACRETLINYHKDGTAYRVDVRITPILDDEREPLWFIAQERKLPMLEPLLVG
jgi:PAS domain S-box-containing protein